MAIEPQSIKPIAKSIVHRICSGQVILDLSSAVKELVENSLDAGATSIEISLKDFGEDSFQVADNGCGISPNNFKALALKHHTSKLADFPDLESLTTFGFRGEALSSLCALGNLSVETRTKNETVATHLTYDHSGLLVAEKKTARQVGTTVTVKKLFSNLPVRSKEFSRNIRREYGKLVSLLNAYALIAKGVRFVCNNTTGKNVRSVVLKTQGSNSLKDNIITVLGMNTFSCLQPLAICISDSCNVDGFVSKPGQGSGRNLGDRQYFFVNGRPVDMPKIGKLVNELYKGSNPKQYPIAILNFTVPTRAYDVNVTPDKRKIFISEESAILQALREGLQKNYSPSNVCYSVNGVEQPDVEEDCVEFNASHTKSSIIVKTSSPTNGSLLQEEHNTQCNDGDVSRDKHMEKHNMEVNNSNIPKNENKEMHITESNNASEFVIDDQCSHVEEKLICDINEVGQKFMLRAHNILKEDGSRIQSRHTGSIMLNQDSLVPRTVKSEATSNKYLSNHSRHVQSTLNKFVTVNKRSHDDIMTALSEMPVLRNQAPQSPLKTANTETNDLTTKSSVYFDQIDGTAKENEIESLKQLNSSCIIHKSENSVSGDSTDRESTMELDQESNISLADKASIAPHSNDLINTTDHDLASYPPLSSSSVRLDSSKSSGQKIFSCLQFSFQDLKKRSEKRMAMLQASDYRCGKANIKSLYKAATLELSQPQIEEQKERVLAAATTELERFFKKEDFSRMKVIGQFNLGFIIGKLDQDLFIVDQHAADEKYNFERLSQSTILNQQPLLRPIRLELSPEEEIVASMHMDIIRKNGFTLEEDPNAPPCRRYKLMSVPFSKNIMFGIEDVKELISTLSDDHGECKIVGSYKMDTSDSICPSRVRAMLASRACRSSIMIGDSLGRNEMQKILEHLAELKSPWNCPHGRPTMRHLVDLTTIHKKSEHNNPDVN